MKGRVFHVHRDRLLEARIGGGVGGERLFYIHWLLATLQLITECECNMAMTVERKTNRGLKRHTDKPKTSEQSRATGTLCVTESGSILSTHAWMVNTATHAHKSYNKKSITLSGIKVKRAKQNNFNHYAGSSAYGCETGCKTLWAKPTTASIRPLSA